MRVAAWISDTADPERPGFFYLIASVLREVVHIFAGLRLTCYFFRQGASYRGWQDHESGDGR
jgi:hypothetical protein